MLISQAELIALNNATTEKRYQFTLDGTVLVFAPDGWMDDEYTMTRDMRLFGVFRKFANSELKFVKDGRDILRDIYEASGVNASCEFIVDEVLSTGATRNKFVGKIDFSTYKITEISVDVAVIDGSFTDLVLSRSKTEINLLGTTTIDGIVIVPLLPKTITIPEIIINLFANWQIWDETDTYIADHILPMLLINSEYTEAETSGINDYFFLDATQEYVSSIFTFDISAIVNVHVYSSA